MKKIIPLILLFAYLFAPPALSSQLNKIELNDGSVIIGEISGLNNGKYTVNSREVGILQIDETRIKQITPVDLPKDPGFKQTQADDLSSEKIETMKNKLMSNPETMGMINSLQNDPQIKDIINDPEIINAIKSGDATSLINNAKLIRLQSNPVIQDIKRKAEENP
jgi:phosphoribosylformylglycinamidine (FGAM) synthase PurS component